LKLIDSMPREAVIGNRRWDLLPRLAGEEGQTASA
jgi:hypothetical protein